MGDCSKEHLDNLTDVSTFFTQTLKIGHVTKLGVWVKKELTFVRTIRIFVDFSDFSNFGDVFRSLASWWKKVLTLGAVT